MSITLSEAETVLAAAKAEARRMGVGYKRDRSRLPGVISWLRSGWTGWGGLRRTCVGGRRYASANFGVPTTDLMELAGNPVFH